MPRARHLSQSRRSRDGDGSRPQTDGKYGIDKTDLELSEIGETNDIPASHHNSAWMASLMHTVGDLLGTKTIVHTNVDPSTGRRSTRTIPIYGSKTKPELAEYLFTVLRRQILKTRLSYFRCPTGKTPGGMARLRRRRSLIRSAGNGCPRSKTAFAASSSLGRLL